MATAMTLSNWDSYTYRNMGTFNPSIVDDFNHNPLLTAHAQLIALTDIQLGASTPQTDEAKSRFFACPEGSYFNASSLETFPFVMFSSTRGDTGQNMTNLQGFNARGNAYSLAPTSNTDSAQSMGTSELRYNIIISKKENYSYNSNPLNLERIHFYSPWDIETCQYQDVLYSNMENAISLDFYYRTKDEVRVAIESGDFYYLKIVPFLYNPTTATASLATQYISPALANPCIQYISNGVEVYDVQNGTYTNEKTVLQGAWRINAPLLNGFLGEGRYNRSSFSFNAVKSRQTNPGLLKGVIKQDEFVGYYNHSSTARVPILKREAIVRYLNILNIPFFITEDTQATVEQMASDPSTWEDYDPNYIYENPEGPPKGQDNNTTSDWVGEGDNTEDSLSLQTPNMNPYSEAVNQYTLNAFDLYHFTRSMYTDTFIDDWERLNADPREGLVSCKFYPFDVKAHDTHKTANREEIVIGEVQMNGVEGNRISSGYNQILELGEFDIREYFGGFLDYQLTSIDIYLPYIGWQQLQAPAVMNRKLKIKYVVDIITGECTCLLISTDGKVERLENTFNGVMGVDIPILVSNHNENMKQTASSILSGVVAVGGAVASFATGGVAAPIAIGAGAASIANSATNIATMMNHVQMGTPVGASTSMWMPQDIIFRITRPTKSEASEFKNRRGYRSNYSTQLKNVTGFVQIDDPFLDGISLHEGEKEQLSQILKGGIFI